MKHNGIGKRAAAIVLCCAGLWGMSPAMAGEAPADSAGIGEKLGQLKSAAEEVKQEALGSWADKITFSGAIEVEASYENFSPAEGEDVDTSDLALSTVELGVDVDLLKHVKGRALLLWEEDDTEPVDLDEGFILLDGADVVPLYLKAGKIYVPFGKYETRMISDPLTLELGETRETALELGVAFGGFQAAVFAFNGDIDEEGSDDHIDDFGASIGYVRETDDWSIDLGLGFLNNITDSDGMTGLIEDGQAEAAEMGFAVALKDDVPGMAAHAVVTVGPFTVIGEYVAMLEDPESVLSDITPGALNDLGLDETMSADALKAWNLEFAYGFDVAEKSACVALGYQGVSDAEEALPERRYIAAASVDLWEGVGLALEYRHDAYETDDDADAVTAKLAIEF